VHHLTGPHRLRVHDLLLGAVRLWACGVDVRADAGAGRRSSSTYRWSAWRRTLVVIMLIVIFWASQRSGPVRHLRRSPRRSTTWAVRGSVHRGAVPVGRSRSAPRPAGPLGSSVVPAWVPTQRVRGRAVHRGGADPVLQARPLLADGFAVFYVPVVVFFLWMVILSRWSSGGERGEPDAGGAHRYPSDTVAADTAKTPVPHDGAVPGRARCTARARAAVDAAREVFAEKGYPGTTRDMRTRRHGRSDGIRHFGSKAALFEEAAVEPVVGS